MRIWIVFNMASLKRFFCHSNSEHMLLFPMIILNIIFLRTSLPLRLIIFQLSGIWNSECMLMHVHAHTHTHTHFLRSYVEESKLCRPKWNFLSPDTISSWFLCAFSFILPPYLKNRNCLWATWPNVVALQVRQLTMARAEFKSWDGASGLRRDQSRIINSQTFSRGKIRHKEIRTDHLISSYLMPMKGKMIVNVS